MCVRASTRARALARGCCCCARALRKGSIALMRTFRPAWGEPVGVCVHMHVYVYMYMYVCLQIHAYIHTHM